MRACVCIYSCVYVCMCVRLYAHEWVGDCVGCSECMFGYGCGWRFDTSVCLCFVSLYVCVVVVCVHVWRYLCVCVEGDAYVYFCWTEMRCTDVFVYIWDRNISHPDVCGKYLSESYTLHLSWSCGVACHVSMRFFFLQNLDLSRIQSFMSWDAVPLHARVSQRKRLIQSDSGVFVIHLELFCHYFKTSMCVFIFISHRVVSDSLKHISSED